MSWLSHQQLQRRPACPYVVTQRLTTLYFSAEAALISISLDDRSADKMPTTRLVLDAATLRTFRAHTDIRERKCVSKARMTSEDKHNLNINAFFPHP